MILEALNIMILEVALSTMMLEVALPIACSGNGGRKKKNISRSGLVVGNSASVATCIVGWMGGTDIAKSSRKNREAVSEFYGDQVLKLKGLVVEAKNSGVQL